MLCNACRDLLSSVQSTESGIWIGPEPELFTYPEQADTWMGSHHIQPDSFLDAVENRCYVCSTIFRDLSHELREQAQKVRTFYQIRFIAPDEGSKTCLDRYNLTFTIEILEGQAPLPKEQVVECYGVFKILPKNEINASGTPLNLSENTFSDICEDQVQQWLTSCVDSHGLCNQDWRTEKSYPARLLNVAKKQFFKLQNFGQGSNCPTYVTLSHCWENEMPLKLTMYTRPMLERGMPVTTLSKRFQDAIEIARWMGINYIWIDALCIEQDDPDDWLVQSARMGNIYTNSYCNIAATSKGPDRGCFTDRTMSLVEPYPVSNPRSDDLSTTHFIGYNDFWSNSLLDTLLHKRAWVLQERLLSPRTIHFGQEQIFWECRCQMACEAYPNGIPHQLCNSKTWAWRLADGMLDPEYRKSTISQLDSLSWAVKLFTNLFQPQSVPKMIAFPPQIYEIWSKTIERYMECKLAYTDDKLVAISGIAQKVAEVTKEGYLAGLWDNSKLPQSLLWYVLGRRQADSTISRKVGAAGCRDYRAPSWSWASLEAKMKWNWPCECDDILIDIFKKSVNLSSRDSKFGRITAAEMEVSGSVFQANIEVTNSGADGTPEEDGQYTLHLIGARDRQEVSIHPTVYLDIALTAKSKSLDVCLLPVCTGWRGRSKSIVSSLAGLLLRKAVPTDEPIYERIGVFSLNQVETDLLYGVEQDGSDAPGNHHVMREKRTITLI